MKIDDTRPVPFEKLGSSIWKDPHIQKGMLATHLDPNTDAASRKPETIARTIDWLDTLLRLRPIDSAAAAPESLPTSRAKRILDLGCGPGLYAEALATLGYHVVGIDWNGLSLAHAKRSAAARGLDIRYVEGDYLADVPEGPFDLVMMIYCDMGIFGDEDRDSLLKRAYRVLNPGGRLVFDVYGENLGEVRKEKKTWDYFGSGGFWSPEGHILLSRTFHYPEIRAFVDQYHVVTDGGVAAFRVWERYYTREEMEHVVGRAGFSSVSIHDDVIPRNEAWPAEVLFVAAST